MTSFSGVAAALASEPVPMTDVDLVDELRVLEEIKCAAEARQARLAVSLDAMRGPDAAVAAEVALARRVSPHRGRAVTSLARILHRELPHTLAAFRAGLIGEWRAMIIARETSCLTAEHRAQVDEWIAADATELSERGDRETASLIRAEAARLDAAAVVERRRRAESERRVSIRPAPDSMVYLTALLPVAEGVGVFASLKQAADTAVATGEVTSHGAAMADELVRRVSGVGVGTPQPVALRVTMPVDSLLGDGEEPADLADHGPVPAGVVRALVADNLDAGVKVWLKRLFVKPETQALVGMDSRARFFPSALAEFIELRDRYCRNAFCGARIRHHDHVTPHAEGGETSAANSQGLCVACNQAKEAPGWSSQVVPGERHTVEITTPSGHRYRSRAPAA